MRLLVSGIVGLCLLSALPAAACLTEQPVEMTASWYGPGHHGRPTANGERFDRNGFTAAHPCLPFGTILDVVEPRTGRSVRVRVNDRGPFKPGRTLDLSEAAAAHVGLSVRGVGKVRVTRIAPHVVCPADRRCLRP